MPETQTEPTKLFDNLPPFPPVAAKLSRALGEDDAAIGAIVDLVASDPALAADILRRANSPIYGFGRRVDSLREALVLLGFGELHRLSLARATAGLTGDALRSFPALRRCWRHSLAVACLAEKLAPEFGVEPEKAYTAGLLHDLGRLGLLAVCPMQYAELLTRGAHEAPADDVAYLLDMEKLVFGVDHCTAGRGLAESWEMPAEILMVAGRHHDRIQNRLWGLLELIQGCSRLADSLGFGALDREERLPIRTALADFPEQQSLEIHINHKILEHYVADRIARLDGDMDAEASAPEDEPATETSSGASGDDTAPLWLVALAGALVAAVVVVLIQLLA